MNNKSNQALVSSPDEGATVVISQRVYEHKHADYEDWLNEIAPLCRASEGCLDWHIIRPVPGLSETFTIVVRFDTEEHLRGWIESPVRKRLIEKAQPLLVTGDDFFISSGLDFWFAPDEAKAKIPIRWKQYLVTWSAIFPLALLVPTVLFPFLRFLGIPPNHYFDAFATSGTIVFLMVYLVMPRYTKLLRNWLFK